MKVYVKSTWAMSGTVSMNAFHSEPPQSVRKSDQPDRTALTQPWLASFKVDKAYESDGLELMPMCRASWGSDIIELHGERARCSRARKVVYG